MATLWITLYRLFVLVIGVTMLGTLSYGLCVFPSETVTNDMLSDPAYLGVLTTCVLLQITTWALFFYAKRKADETAVVWGFLVLLIMTVGWLGLITNLHGIAHVIFVASFASFVIIAMLILSYLVWQPIPNLVIRVGLVVTLFCCTFMLVLYNNNDFYLPEQVGFITYSVFFTVFFCLHTCDQWGADQWEETDWEMRAAGEDGHGDVGPLLQPCAYYAPVGQRG